MLSPLASYPCAATVPGNHPVGESKLVTVSSGVKMFPTMAGGDVRQGSHEAPSTTMCQWSQLPPTNNDHTCHCSQMHPQGWMLCYCHEEVQRNNNPALLLIMCMATLGTKGGTTGWCNSYACCGRLPMCGVDHPTFTGMQEDQDTRVCCMTYVPQAVEARDQLVDKHQGVAGLPPRLSHFRSTLC